MSYKVKQFLDCQFTGYEQLPKQGLVFESAFFQLHQNYKKDDNYVKGIRDLYTFVSNNNAVLRVWCDQFRYNQLKQEQWVKQSKNIQLVVFKCPAYMKQELHEGLFGSVIRFIPMSLPGNHFVTDIDLNMQHFSKITFMIEAVKSQLKFDYLCIVKEYEFMYEQQYHKTDYFKYNNKQVQLPYVLAGYQFIRKPIDLRLLSEFMQDPDTNKRVNDKYVNSAKIKSTINSRFPYGLDEVYINQYFIPYIYKSRFKIGIYSIDCLLSLTGSFLLYYNNQKLVKPILDVLESFAQQQKDNQYFYLLAYVKPTSPQTPEQRNNAILNNIWLYKQLQQNKNTKSQIHTFIGKLVQALREQFYNMLQDTDNIKNVYDSLINNMQTLIEQEIVIQHILYIAQYKKNARRHILVQKTFKNFYI